MIRLLTAFAFFAGAFAGCVTQEQVQSIVSESNYQILVADAEAAATQLQPDPRQAQAPADSVLARIDSFIAQHPDQPALTSPLRLRQAILFLNKKAFASADAAFDAIDPAGLHTERDQTIYRIRDALGWWYEHANDNGNEFRRVHETRATAVSREFADAAGSAKGNSEIRDYLLEARAWINLKLAGAKQNGARAAAIVAALDPLASALSTAELSQLATGNLADDTPAFSPSARRVLRVDTILDEAAKLVDTPAPVLANADLQRALEKRMP